MTNLIKYIAPTFILISGVTQPVAASCVQGFCQGGKVEANCSPKTIQYSTGDVYYCCCAAGFAPTPGAKTNNASVTHQSVLLYNNIVNELTVDASTNRKLSIITYRLIWSGLNKLAIEEGTATLQEYEFIYENLLSARQKELLNHHRKLMKEALKYSNVRN